MPRLSAIDSVNPAIERARWMLIPFRFSTWFKLGFIGWLAGELGSAGGGLNFPTSFPGRGKMPPTGIPDLHFPAGLLVIVVVAVAVIFLLALIFLYLSARFRFILFDSVIHGRADIARGWSSYVAAANRFFGFSVVYAALNLLLVGLLIGLPLWHAYKSGVFSGGDVLKPILVLIGSILLVLVIFGLTTYLIGTAFRDFVAPLLALDNLTLGEAWANVGRLVRAEPGAFAGYVGMKLVLAIAAAILVGLATFLCIFILFIPAVIIAVVLIAVAAAFKAKIVTIGIIALGVVLALVFLAAMFALSLTLQAPVAVFFESYRLYFFAGRYPKLASLMWPEPPAVPVPPAPGGFTPPPPIPGVTG